MVYEHGCVLEKVPVIGRYSVLLPRTILNFIYAFKSQQIIERGYQEFKDRTCQFIRIDGQMLLLPLNLLEELSSIPNHIASRNKALEHDLLGRYTGISLILDSRLHHTIIQRKLTPRLEQVAPVLEGELAGLFEEYLPASSDRWTIFQPHHVFAKISSRLSARMLVGPELCRNEEWLEVSVKFTESLFTSVAILRFLPPCIRSFVGPLLPSYWQSRNYLRIAKGLLSPVFEKLLEEHDTGKWELDNTNEANLNMIAWLVDSAKGADRDASTLAHIEVLLALASVHTTLQRLISTLYDLTANPSYIEDILQEIGEVQSSGWSISSYAKLRKMDSILRESQRMSPPTIVGMKRIFQAPYTFTTGFHVPAGAHVCLPTFAIENDPAVTPSPEIFDGLRSYRKRLASKVSSHGKDQEHIFTTPEKTMLGFGFGKTACPGRFFADVVLKMVCVKMFQEYEFKFMEAQSRPKNFVLHDWIFTRPWDTMMVRKKNNGFGSF
ncbi:cytochrome P450 [Periconia macrospinosa]|uniref:Cytochrome P450 n=1 Tax=Periconia macrospinosa TaxID=97972 RepID=A0A2V1DHS8_9PLEO|nr:cytochrome P450 [Periconia macrospinosa]